MVSRARARLVGRQLHWGPLGKRGRAEAEGGGGERERSHRDVGGLERAEEVEEEVEAMVPQ